MREPLRPVVAPILSIALLAAIAVASGARPAAAQARRPAPEILRLGAVSTGTSVTAARPCGTPAVLSGEAEGVRTALRRWLEEDAGFAPGGTVRVAFHILTSGGDGDVTDERLARQIDVLNRAYEGTGYRFELARVDRTEAPDWHGMARGSAAERQAREALAVEPARHLNIFVCRPAAGVSGWASYPWSAPESHPDQGIVLDHAVLPGGTAAEDEGSVAVHQVGHYLGLVDEAGGHAPGHAGFDAGRIERMQSVVAIFRPSLFTAPAPRIPGRPEISPTEGAEPEDGRVLSYRGAFPNPFRAETLLRFTLPMSGPVSLRIYSVTGQLVRTLVDASLPPGDHSAMFRAEDLPSGAYFAVLRAGSARMTRTLMLVR